VAPGIESAFTVGAVSLIVAIPAPRIYSPF
jgi:biopolymer transport protein ExbB/TolQ